MSYDNSGNSGSGVSISGNAVALVVANSDSLASVLHESGMEMRDFIVLSFVADQGPVISKRLAKLVGVDLLAVLLCIQRLNDAGFVVSSTSSDPTEREVIATALGNRVADKILSQL